MAHRIIMPVKRVISSREELQAAMNTYIRNRNLTAAVELKRLSDILVISERDNLKEAIERG